MIPPRMQNLGKSTAQAGGKSKAINLALTLMMKKKKKGSQRPRLFLLVYI